MAWITPKSDPCYCSSNYLFCFHEFIQLFMRRDTFSAVNLFQPLNEKKNYNCDEKNGVGYP